jgi:hypothetical protein
MLQLIPIRVPPLYLYVKAGVYPASFYKPHLSCAWQLSHVWHPPDSMTVPI